MLPFPSLLLLPFFLFPFLSLSSTCSKYDPLTNSCLACSRGYSKHPSGNCYSCKQQIIVNGVKKCVDWILSGKQKGEGEGDGSGVMIVLVILVGVIVVGWLGVKVWGRRRSGTKCGQKLWKKEQREEKELGTRIEDKTEGKIESAESQLQRQNKSRLTNIEIVKEQFQQKKIISPLLIQSTTKTSTNLLPDTPSQPLQTPTNPNTISIPTPFPHPPQQDICYYCKLPPFSCQTSCNISCHIECQIQQFKNLHQCFRCKSKEFHCYGKCEGCKEYRVRLMLCGGECEEEEHINCYGRLNYEEYCEECRGRDKENLGGDKRKEKKE